MGLVEVWDFHLLFRSSRIVVLVLPQLLKVGVLSTGIDTNFPGFGGVAQSYSWTLFLLNDFL